MPASVATCAQPACAIDRMGREDIAPTAHLLAQAFRDNPCYRFMHPRSATQSADLRAFFVRNLSWRQPLELTWVVRDDQREPIGTATLQPPGTLLGRDLAKLLSHWVVPTLAQQGAHTFVRTLHAERAFSREQRLAAGAPAYWLVHAVAVRPDLQGRALGSALMRRLLTEVRARNTANMPVVLATQHEANLAFYARFGFRLTHQRTIGRSARRPGFVSWFMRHEPDATADMETGSTNS